MLLCAFTPIFVEHGETRKVDDEFKNIYKQAQGKQFVVFQATPNLNDLEDMQVVIVSSGTYTKLMYRVGQDIFAIAVSCATVRR